MKPSSAAPKELAKKLKEGLATGHQWWGTEEGGDRYVNLSLLIPDCESIIKILEVPPAVEKTALAKVKATLRSLEVVPINVDDSWAIGFNNALAIAQAEIDAASASEGTKSE